MTSVFYLAGEDDPGGQAADSQTMYDAGSDPRRIEIYPGVADHGIVLLENQASARTFLLEWLEETL